MQARQRTAGKYTTERQQEPKDSQENLTAGTLKPNEGRSPMRCFSNQNKKPKLKHTETLELPRNLQGWRGATACSHQVMSNKADAKQDGGQKKRKASWHVILDFTQQKQLKGSSGKMKHKIKRHELTIEPMIMYSIVTLRLVWGSPLHIYFLIRKDLKRD